MSSSSKKHDLFEKRSNTSNSNKNNNRSTQEEAQHITDSLVRTKQMLQQELSRISEVSNAIDKDGKVLESTKDQHRAMGTTAQGAKRTLTKLQLQQRQDAIAFWMALFFFYGAVFYVIWTRIRIPFLLW